MQAPAAAALAVEPSPDCLRQKGKTGHYLVETQFTGGPGRHRQTLRRLKRGCADRIGRAQALQLKTWNQRVVGAYPREEHCGTVPRTLEDILFR